MRADSYTTAHPTAPGAGGFASFPPASAGSSAPAFGGVRPSNRAEAWRTAVPRWRALALRLALVLAGLLLALAGFEAFLRIRMAVNTPADMPVRVPLHVPTEGGWVYGLNPENAEVNALGLRGAPVTPAKPAGTTRVLVLGDSVTYGTGVAAEATFSAELERLLRAEGRAAQVLNAGVTGWTAWNELRWYEERGRALDPDVVLVVFCPNDVVDPELHWDALARMDLDVPAAAVPDAVYHREHVEPILRVYRQRRSPLLAARWAVLRLYVPWRAQKLAELGWEEHSGARIPIYLTSEDTLSIRVLEDPDAPQSRWLRATYCDLRDAVRADGARFAAVLAPLGYQLEPGYPYRPQARLARDLEAEGIPTLDLLRAMDGRPSERLFRGAAGGYDDVWHFGEEGHRFVAARLAEFLAERGLVDVPTR